MTWVGSVFIWSRRTLFIGEAGIAEDHALHAITICLAVKGNFTLQMLDAPIQELPQCSAVIIDAGATHNMAGTNAEQIIIVYLLTETEEARRIKETYLATDKVYEIPPAVAGTLLSGIEKLRETWFWQCETAESVCDKIVSGLIDLPSTALSRNINYHVRRIIEYLYAELDAQVGQPKFNEQRFAASTIIEELGLYWSEDQLENKVRESTTLSLDEYINLLKLRAAIEHLGVHQQQRNNLTRLTLTRVADTFGMKISNFSYAFKHMLGINASVLRDDSRFVPCDKLKMSRPVQ